MTNSSPPSPNPATMGPGLRRDDGSLSEAVEAITSPSLTGTRHGFFGRRGGVSSGIHSGLNVGLGSEDEPQAVAENRRRAVEAVAPGGALVTCYQVHGAQVVTAQAPWADDARPHADAMVTDRPGLALGILSADCAPILLTDAAAGVIGAAHAGWKGALGGVAEATLAAMERLGADRARVTAAVGPCIARRSYEVDAAFFCRFTEADADYEAYFTPGASSRFQFDLEGFVASRLAAAGVTRAEALGLDTYADEDRFFSFRRATHRGEPGYGRQLSLIALPE